MERITYTGVQGCAYTLYDGCDWRNAGLFVQGQRLTIDTNYSQP